MNRLLSILRIRRLVRACRFFLVILTSYLIQVCVMPYIKVWGISPNFAIAVIGVVTVCFGIWRAFWAGSMIGIMTEVMIPSRPLMNLALYPLCALLCSVVFSDKNPRQLEYERALGKAGRNTSPYLRTILCAISNSILFELVNIVYVYLRDGIWDAAHLQKGLLTVVLTTIMTLIIMLPLRRLFGFKRIPPEKKGQKLYQTETRP